MNMDRLESLPSTFPILDGNNYALRSDRMQTYLLAIGVDVLLSVENGYKKPNSDQKSQQQRSCIETMKRK